MSPLSAIPDLAAQCALLAVVRSREELSIVCAEESVPRGVTHARGFACLKLRGPFPLEESGVLASFLAPLAEARVPAFALSTYDTDYVLIPHSKMDDALRALHAAGHVPDRGAT